VENLEVLTDGDLGGIELSRKFADQSAAIPVNGLQNSAATFLVEHRQETQEL
jgi:hypothetical protein